jgi:predicted dinucleotide-binding enzyme
MKSIGIIGTGNIGKAIATALVRHGIPVTLANSRGPDSLKPLVAELGPHATAGTSEQAASKDIVFVAVNWSKLPAALGSLPDFGDRIVVDTNNPIEAPLFKPFELNGQTSSEIFATLARGGRIVKAFNHLLPELLTADPAREGGKRVLFYSGDDAAAKREIGALIEKLGFFGIDMGTLVEGGKPVQFPGGPLPALNLVKFA